MNLKCPFFGSLDTHKGDLLYHCDNCGEMEERYTEAPLNRPVLEKSGFRSGGSPRGQWRVTVWSHPKEPTCYSYAVAINGGVMAAPGGGTKHGCYKTAAEALTAGVAEVNRL